MCAGVYDNMYVKKGLNSADMWVWWRWEFFNLLSGYQVRNTCWHSLPGKWIILSEYRTTWNQSLCFNIFSFLPLFNKIDIPQNMFKYKNIVYNLSEIFIKSLNKNNKPSPPCILRVFSCQTTWPTFSIARHPKPLRLAVIRLKRDLDDTTRDTERQCHSTTPTTMMRSSSCDIQLDIIGLALLAERFSYRMRTAQIVGTRKTVGRRV